MLCECGCGLEVTKGSRLRWGHASEELRRLRIAIRNGSTEPIGAKPDLCVCGCGERVSRRAKYARACWLARKRQLNICACGCGQTVKSIGSVLCRGHYTPELWQKWSDARRLNNPMKNPVIVAKAMSKVLKHGKQSKLEAWFETLCREQGLPVWFTGRGDYWVSGRNPDFKVHGRKLVIEVTDGYCRNAERRTVENYALPTIRHYRKHGHECLVVKLPVRPRVRDEALRQSVATAIRHFLDCGSGCVWSLPSERAFIGAVA